MGDGPGRVYPRPVRTATCLSAGLASALALGSSNAPAYDSLAKDCDEVPDKCQIAPIAFAAQSPNALDLSFDTGWVPSSGPLQVHLAAGVYAKTDVALAGYFAASWPDAIVLETPGKVDGGWLAIQYGAEVVAEAKISISVLGQSVNFTGPIPYIPQFDFVVDDDVVFDSWAFDPGASASGETMPATLAQVGIDQIIGTNIPGLDGGFELNASIELTATYITERMVLLDPVTGFGVAGGDILEQDGLSAFDYAGGPFFEVDVHPEGRVVYDGVLHLIPAFFVEFLGQDFSIPIADIPIPFSTEETWIFDPQRVHVPLPDIEVSTAEIDFGEGSIDAPAYTARPVKNDGEAILVYRAESSDPAVVQVDDEPIEVEPGEEAAVAMIFSPESSGEHTATITLTSNDPDEPVIELLAAGVGNQDRAKIRFGGGSGGPTDLEDGCGCKTAGAPSPSNSGWAFALLGVGLWARARRSRAPRR